MSEQAKIEKLLKDIHVLFSKCETYDNDSNRIIVDKRKLFSLLEQINLSMYRMMDQYEITSQSKERAERKAREKGEEIILDATKKADDVYAAAVLYTDDALDRLRERIGTAMEELDELYFAMRQELVQEDKLIAGNQQELKTQLEEMIEDQKYLHMMEEENKRRAAGRPKKEEGEETHTPLYKPFPKPELFNRDEPIRIVAPAPEIKVNPAYEENTLLDSFAESTVISGGPQINVNLDAEYFKWKNQGLPEVEEGVIERPKELLPRETSEESLPEEEEDDSWIQENEIAEFVSRDSINGQKEKKDKKFLFGRK